MTAEDFLLATIYSDIVQPNVLVVTGRRGYRLSWLAEKLHCSEVMSYTGWEGVFSCCGSMVASAQVKLARHLERWCVENQPKAKPRAFIPSEEWHKIKAQKEFRNLVDEGRVYEMQIPYMDKVYQDEQAFRDAWGNYFVDSKKDAKMFVLDQPESRFLRRSVPGCQDANRSSVTRLEQDIRQLLRDDDEASNGWKWKNVAAFIEFCELIGAGKRIRGGRWQWTPLWLTGLREMAKELA